METTVTKLRKRLKIFPPPYLPYERQKEPIKAMIDTILKGENGLVVQPTATGKSVEAAFAARACILLHGMRGLYLYDENEGLSQARKRCAEIFGKNDITCANFFGYSKDDNVDAADMVFASFQSMNSQYEKWYTMFDPKHFDFMIVNEAHGGQAETYKEVIDYFSCSKIGMTATPKRMDGKDILEIFDKVIYYMSLVEAIAKNWVAKVDYRIMSNGLSTQKLNEICREVLEEGKRVSKKQLNETIFIEMLDDEMLKEVYAEAFPEYGKPLQTLIFCENIDHADHVYDLLKKEGMSVGVIHSKKGRTHNRDTMNAFRNNSIQFLISIDKLNEDIDVPNVQLVVFLRGTDSETIFFQQLGRGLRILPTKEKLIVLDFVANCERLVYIKSFEREVEEILEKSGIVMSELDKRVLNVSGKGFDLKYAAQAVDLLKVLAAIEEGFYATWQEASTATQALGIKNWAQYRLLYKQDPRLPGHPSSYYSDFPEAVVFWGGEEKYKTWKEASLVSVQIGFKTGKEYISKWMKHDLRLPSNPEDLYEDFPGWPIFLGINAQDGWKPVNEIEDEFKVFGEGKGTILSFVLRYKSNHSGSFKDFYSEGSRKIVPHYSPSIVRIVNSHFRKKHLLLSSGWKSAYQLRRDGIGGTKAIMAFVESIGNQHQEMIAELWVHGTFISHYSPDLINLIKQYVDETKISDGWEAASALSKKGKFADQGTIKSFASKFRESHPHHFKVVVGVKNRSEYFSPTLIRLMRWFFSKKPLPPQGWKNINDVVKQGIAQRPPLTNYLKQYRESNVEWFKFFWNFNRFNEYFHPDLVQKAASYFQEIYSSPPEGWISFQDLNYEVFGVGGHNSRNKKIRTFIEEQQLRHPEWVKSFSKSNRKPSNHYHPDLIKKIKEHFAKKKGE